MKSIVRFFGFLPAVRRNRNSPTTRQTRKAMQILVALLLTVPASTSAQDEKTKELFFSAGGGLAFPLKPKAFSDYWNMGFNVGGGFGFSLSPSLSLTTSIDYNSFAFDSEGLLKAFGLSGSGVTATGGSASVLTITGDIKVLIIPAPETIAPFVTAGVGVFSLSAAELSVAYPGFMATKPKESKSALSLLLGGGIEIPAGALVLFIEGKYGMGFTKGETTTFIPIKGGIKITI